MPALILPKGSIMTWAGNAITEHNRGPLSVDYESIEYKQRMASGSLRKIVIAQKRTFKASWDNVPDDILKTVDQKWSAREIENFYNSQLGVQFALMLSDGTTAVTYTVIFDQFSKSIVKRYPRMNLWKIDVSLEEV